MRQIFFCSDYFIFANYLAASSLPITLKSHPLVGLCLCGIREDPSFLLLLMVNTIVYPEKNKLRDRRR